MKLLLENWRKYLVESEQESYCGDLYLFEGDTVTKTSFYDALNILSESDNDVDTFLENWERSVDYQLENLNEQEFDAILKLSTQAWMLQNKLKEKAAGKVLAVSKKINDFAEKNPKTVKVAKVVVGGLFAAAAVYGISQILQSGGDASDVMELAQSIQPEDPSLAQDLAECAQEFNPQKVAEFAQEQQEVVEKVADTLSTAGEPALDQAGQAADNVAQDMPDSLDSWADMFEEAAVERASGDAVADLKEVPDNFFDAVSPKDMCKTLTPAPAGCTGKPGDVPDFTWQDGNLSDSWRQADDLKVLKKNYKFDPSGLSGDTTLDWID